VPPAPDASGVVTQWHLAIVPLVLAVLLVALYAAGLSRARRSGSPWPIARTAAYLVLGVGSYVAVTLGFLGVYSSLLRWAFAAQAALLLLVIPVLLALGKPIALAREALGESGIRRLDRFLKSRAVRILTHPVGGPGLLLAVLLLFLTPLPSLVRTHAVALAAAQVALPALGLVAVAPVAAGDEPGTSTTMAIGFLIAFFELIADALPGILLRLHQGVIGGSAIPGLAPPWLPTALRDQQLSGDVLWFLGEAIDIPFLAWLVVRWIRADAREAAVVDARLDAQYAAPAEHSDAGVAAATAAPGERSGPRPVEPPELMRPWWEVEAEQRAVRDAEGRAGS
jgi:putative membrane protein